MNNFSDLLAINKFLEINLRLGVIKHNGAPWVTVCINQQRLYDDFIRGPLDLTGLVGLMDPITISIDMREKKYSATLETAVTIDQLVIEQFSIVPAWTHLATYSNDHGQAHATSYLGFNGTWSLHIPAPFYHWRHRILAQGWLLEPTILTGEK